eukprot:Nk52_evm11s372 gene=Nk52_evmTU11s372
MAGMGLRMNLKRGLNAMRESSLGLFRRFTSASNEADVTEKLKYARNLVPQTDLFPGTEDKEFYVVDGKKETTNITALGNGIKVASENVPGPIATIGVLVDAGSRYENPSSFGTSHFVDRMSFKSTKNRTQEELNKELEKMGGMASCSSGRECITYTASVFKYDMPAMLDLIADTIHNPVLSDEELEMQKESIMFELEDMYSKPDVVLPEIIHYAAYKDNTLGNPLICPNEHIQGKSKESILEFMKKFYVGPRMVVVGTGVDHEEFVDLSKSHFGNICSESNVVEEKAVYTGGEIRLDGNFPLAHVSLAFEGVGWAEDELYAVATLQLLMGGGGSFSAGGPGKGMYSRLFTNVLNRYHWVESISAYNSSYKDSGLFGMYGTCLPDKVPNLMTVMCNEFIRMTHKIDISELERAKNQLKSSVLMNLESRFVHFEDIGRQVLAHGKRETPKFLCDKIDEVTAEDINRVAFKMLSSAPTMAAYGDLLHLPPIEIIAGRFK